MECKHCGNELNDKAKFCDVCGASTSIEIIEPIQQEDVIPEMEETEDELTSQDLTYIESLIEKYKYYKKKYKFKIIIIIVLISIVAFLIALCVSVFNSFKEYTEDKIKQGDTKIEEVKKYDDFFGYDFNDFGDYDHYIKDDILTVSSEDEQWGSMIGVVPINIDIIKNNLNIVKENYEKLGFNLTNFKETNYNNISYMTSEISQDTKNMILGLTGNKEGQTFVIIGFTNDYKLNYTPLANISNFITNYNFNKENITTNLKTKIFDFSNIK